MKKICKICNQEFETNKFRPEQEICSSENCQYLRQMNNQKKWRYLHPIYNHNRRLQMPQWERTWRSIESRCKWNKKNKDYYQKGIKNFLTIDDLKFLWFRDKAYEMKRPSIDRIDDTKDYTLDNCRYLELSKNIARKWEKLRDVRI